MNNGLLQILVEEDGGYVKEGQNWGRSDTHSSLVVNEEKQKWYWNSEQMGGGVLEYLIRVRGLPRKLAQEVLDTRGRILNGIIGDFEDKKVYDKPYEKLVDTFWSLGKRNRQYWYDRKLNDKTIDRYRLGYTANGWYTIPLYIGDRFVNFQCRRDIPEKRIKMWYRIEGWKPVIINPELLQIVDTIFITEGSVDALLLNQEGIPAVSHTGGAYWNPEWCIYFNKIKKIYYIMDNDAVGKATGAKVAKSLGLYRTYLYEFEGKPEKYDTRDFFKDGGTAKEFKELVERDSKLLFEIGELDESRIRYRRSNKTLAY